MNLFQLVMKVLTKIKLEGKNKKFDFEPKEHFELGENLKLMSFDKASKISGSRFVIQSGLLAKLEGYSKLHARLAYIRIWLRRNFCSNFS